MITFRLLLAISFIRTSSGDTGCFPFTKHSLLRVYANALFAMQGHQIHQILLFHDCNIYLNGRQNLSKIEQQVLPARTLFESFPP